MDKFTIAHFWCGQPRNHYEDDDLIDRLNGRCTVLALMTAFLVVTFALVVGGPINSWTPSKTRFAF